MYVTEINKLQTGISADYTEEGCIGELFYLTMTSLDGRFILLEVKVTVWIVSVC